MIRRLIIAADDLAGLKARASASPVEICALLLGAATGDAAHVTAVMQAENVAADPARAFEVDPKALFAAHRAARDGGPVPIGVAHSHPAGAAEPSATDHARARDEPGLIWLILGHNGAAAAFLAGETGLAPIRLEACAQTGAGL